MTPSQWISRVAMIAAALMHLTGATAGANASDTLQKMLARMPAPASGNGILFDFLSPTLVRSWPPVEIPGVGPEPLNKAVLESAPVIALTGIDFASLGGILAFGEPPGDVLFLSGPGIDEKVIAAALSARGFERSNVAGATAYAKGEDFRLDLAARDPVDPFGKLLGMSQRIAVGPFGIIETRAWPPLRANLAIIVDTAKPSDPDRTGGALYTEMAAAGAAAFPGGEAYAASGFDARAFAQSQDVYERDRQVRNARKGPIPPFLCAFLIAAIGGGHEAAQIVLAYKNLSDADVGIAEVARRLAVFEKLSPRAGATVVTSTARSSTGAFAIATLTFPANDDHLSSQAFSSWRTAIYNRGFVVLDLSP